MRCSPDRRSRTDECCWRRSATTSPVTGVSAFALALAGRLLRMRPVATAVLTRDLSDLGARIDRMFGRRRTLNDLGVITSSADYHPHMSGSAFDVAAAIREFQPGVPAVKLQKLLYYCQGHHLAATGREIFSDTVSAFDMGPVVAVVWRVEKDGLTERRGAAERLDESELNTVGYVMHRYGNLSGRDLIRLSHGETPWRDADALRKPGGRVTITAEAIETYFREQRLADEGDEPMVDVRELYQILEGSDYRRDTPAEPDSMVELRRRMADLQQ